MESGEKFIKATPYAPLPASLTFSIDAVLASDLLSYQVHKVTNEGRSLVVTGKSDIKDSSLPLRAFMTIPAFWALHL